MGVSRDEAAAVAKLLAAYYTKILRDPECSAAQAESARKWLENLAVRFDDSEMPEYDDGLGHVPVFEDD